ncbi:hypothetical protein DFH09DRAFT_1339145 [Mycena vulgaris]|nr:hypothetical protein DFH09DRAFT_1339145 [Mycena vulgaris]
MSPRLDFTPFRTQYFFSVTTILAIVVWFLTLVSQAIATAKFGNRFVGALWFAILLQGFFTLGVIGAIATDSVQTSRLQLAIFGAVAVVFAVQGVDQGIFSASPELNLMAAGYLIIALIDILWVLYFTSEEDSLALHIFSRLGTGGLTPPARRRRTRGQSVASAAMASNNTIKGRTDYSLGTGVGSEDLNHEMKRGSVARSGLVRSGTGGRSITSRKSLVGSTYGGATSESEQVPAVEVVPPMPAPVRPMPLPMPPQIAPPAVPVPGAGSRPASRELEAASASSGAGADEGTAATPSGEPDVTAEDAEPPLRARALHAYHGSPEDSTELSFAKGEILEIEDQEGKWWQAKKADGTLGIVPSNYLVMI